VREAREREYDAAARKPAHMKALHAVLLELGIHGFDCATAYPKHPVAGGFHTRVVSREQSI
jgi:hypothetical protein